MSLSFAPSRTASEKIALARRALCLVFAASISACADTAESNANPDPQTATINFTLLNRNQYPNPPALIGTVSTSTSGLQLSGSQQHAIWSTQAQEIIRAPIATRNLYSSELCNPRLGINCTYDNQRNLTRVCFTRLNSHDSLTVHGFDPLETNGNAFGMCINNGLTPTSHITCQSSDVICITN